MSAKIDITEVEQATKIRAKYLRAIENEEWQLLPGSTFAKSFIRTYAEYLGVDSRSLVEEYKLRYERPSESELRAVSPGLSRDRRGGRSAPAGRGPQGGGGGGVPRWAVTVALVAVLLGALWVIGNGGGDDDGGGGDATPTTQTQARRGGARGGDRRAPARQPTRRAAVRTEAGVRLTPTGEVYVCLVDQDDNVLIPGTIYAAGQTVPVRRARSMRLTLGNSNVQMVVNGRPVEVPASAGAIGFAITTRGAAQLPEDQRPLCE